ncbi:hypothetical protein EDB81DRAFT_952143 [Dactylonectria macrodidyma]|uniref:Uncharacterized protein n=1 Tax=Dactylonectria macrodidyma TaxID=307937 RepID=A0A9P9IJB2_9HYPO|nr:hypothetical protein EDB81DRAFT_952143 [Dactylonectria macrodidyma]
MSFSKAPIFEAMPTLVSLDLNSLHPMCRIVAQDRPQDFLAYLNQGWRIQGFIVLRNPSVLTDLQNINVLCEDGKTHPLCKTYLPLPKLKWLQSRYMLSNEAFPFLQMSPGSVTDSDLGEWAFLKNDIGVGAESDVLFFITMIVCVKRHNPTNIQFPRRLLEMYLRLHAISSSLDPAIQKQQNLRHIFDTGIIHTAGGWRRPEECILESPCLLASRRSVFPVPDDWEASKLEVAELKDFYTSTVGIQELTDLALIEQLEYLRQTKVIEDVSKLAFANNFYKALDTMRKQNLSSREAEALRSHFAGHPRVAIMSGDNLTWITSTACAWAPGLIHPGLNNLFTQYPESRSFWVDFLGVEETNIATFYNELLFLPAGNPSIQKAKSLIVALSGEVDRFGDFIDKLNLLQMAVFPVLQANGEVKLRSIETPFAIADKKHLREAFAGKLELLDLDPTTIWQIENFLVWADIEPRYLSWNVEERVEYNGTCVTGPGTADLIHSIAEGLVRIAVHFQSPRATNSSAKEALLRTLRGATVPIGLNMRSILVYSTDEKHVEADSPLPGVSIHGFDQMTVCIPEDRHKRQLCWATSLPKSLVEWLMAESETEPADSIDERAVSLVKSLLMLSQDKSPTFVKDVLDAEGIVDVDVDAMTILPYVPQDNVPILGEGPSQPSKTTSQVDTPSPGTNQRILTPQRRPGTPTDSTLDGIEDAIRSLNIPEIKHVA